MKKIYIVQHCQSEHHINDLTGGSTDTPLTALGRKQAVAVAKELKSMGLHDFHLLSSDLTRATMTAEAIQEAFSQDMTLVKALREIHNGDAMNQTKQWAQAHAFYDASVFELDRPQWRNAETPRALYQRMKQVIQDYMTTQTKDLVIVSHGVAIAYLISAWLGISVEQMKHSFLKGHAGGISLLAVSPLGQNTLIHFNQTSHLKHLMTP